MQQPHAVNPPRLSGNVGHAISDRHKSASRMLGYSLTANLPSVWDGCAIVWEARLTPDERCELARSVLMAMRPEDIADLATDMLVGAGHPLPPFIDSLDDARHWAQIATMDELRAYCLAAFTAMAPNDRRDFLDYAGVAA